MFEREFQINLFSGSVLQVCDQVHEPERIEHPATDEIKVISQVTG